MNDRKVNTPEENISKLPIIIEEFDSLRQNYMLYVESNDFSMDSLKLYRTRFCDLRSAIRSIKSSILFLRSRHDDKNATAYKSRIVKKIMEKSTDEFKDTLPKMSFNSAKELAPSSVEYKDFLSKRSIYYQAYDEISGLREDLQNFINDTTGRINTFWTRGGEEGE